MYPAMSSKVFGQAFFKKLAGRGEFAEQTHSEASESPRRSPQRAKLPQPSKSEEKGGLGEQTKGVSAPIYWSFVPLNAKSQMQANFYKSPIGHSSHCTVVDKSAGVML